MGIILSRGHFILYISVLCGHILYILLFCGRFILQMGYLFTCYVGILFCVAQASCIMQGHLHVSYAMRSAVQCTLPRQYAGHCTMHVSYAGHMPGHVSDSPAY